MMQFRGKFHKEFGASGSVFLVWGVLWNLDVDTSCVAFCLYLFHYLLIKWGGSLGIVG
jgi:hypothetical protein